MNAIPFRKTLPVHAFALSLALVALAGCDVFGDDDEDEPDAGTVLVANQGNFTEANGSVTSYDPQTEVASEAVSASELGSIIQGALAEGDRYYVVANTTGRLNVYDSQTLTPLGQSQGLGANPRYLALDGGTAYVTNQKFGAPSNVLLLDVSDAGSITVEDSIAVSGQPEGITMTAQRAYTPMGAFSDTTLVAALDLTRHEVIKNIDIECYARFAFTDEEGEVLLPCNDADGNGAVVVLDGASGNVARGVPIDLPGTVTSAGGGATQAASYAPGSEELYVVLDGNRVARISTDGTGSANTLDDTISIPGDDPIGAVGYDAAVGRLYLGRVPGFAETGAVTIHRRDGEEIGRFPAGNAPAYISFVDE